MGQAMGRENVRRPNHLNYLNNKVLFKDPKRYFRGHICILFYERDTCFTIGEHEPLGFHGEI